MGDLRPPPRLPALLTQQALFFEDLHAVNLSVDFEATTGFPIGA